MIDQEIHTNPKIVQEILTNLKIVQEILTIHKIVQEIPTNQHHMIVVIGIIMTVIVIIAITIIQTIVIEMIAECIHPEKKIVDPDLFHTSNNNDQMFLIEEEVDHLGT